MRYFQKSNTANFSKKYSSLLFSVCALSLFFPSSINGEIVGFLTSIGQIFCITLLFLIAKKLGFIKKNVEIALVVIFLITFFTLISPIQQITIGALIPYLGFLLVLSTDLTKVKIAYIEPKILHGLIIGLLIFAWGIILNIEFITKFEFNFYQMYSDSLFEEMVVWYSKPVSVFATHSVAAFAYFWLALACFKFRAVCTHFLSKSIWFIYGLLFLCCIPLLLSNSAIGLTVILIFLGLRKLLSGRKKITLLLVFGVVVVLLSYAQEIVEFIDVSLNITNVITNDGNGLSGRFKEGNRLEPTYNYLISNYFLPIGINFDNRLALGDNFIAEYVIRISFVGYMFVLLMLYNFLKRNLSSRSSVYFFLFIFILADQGYPLLTTFRFIFMFPVVVIMWNGSLVSEGNKC